MMLWAWFNLLQTKFLDLNHQSWFYKLYHKSVLKFNWKFYPRTFNWENFKIILCDSLKLDYSTETKHRKVKVFLSFSVSRFLSQTCSPASLLCTIFRIFRLFILTRKTFLFRRLFRLTICSQQFSSELQSGNIEKASRAKEKLLNFLSQEKLLILNI